MSYNADPLATINLRRTPQSEQADPRQTQNAAGGFTFVIDPMARLRRFLVLGTTGGTYYATERELTKDNADMVLDLARNHGSDVVAEVLAISTAGRAPKQNPALFALAAVSALGDPEARKAAHAVLPLVARTGTHLFIFARYAEQFRGWGRGLRRAVGSWYTGKTADDLAYQVAKYRQREGWSHRDLLRLSHPAAPSDEHRAVYDFACGRDEQPLSDKRPALLDAFLQAQSAEVPATTARLVRNFPGLSWEMLRPDHLNEPDVWEALLDNKLPQTALMRQLPRLTKLGVLTRSRGTLQPVLDQLADPERLRKARVHPINVLVALRTYSSGQSVRGDSTWAPIPAIVDALDSAFYAAFGAVEPAGKRTMLALDVSGSMEWTAAGNLPLTCREASAAMAMVTSATEPETTAFGFTSYGRRTYGNPHATSLTPLDLSPRRRLDDVIRSVSNLPFGGTDCAAPMVYAREHAMAVDTFIVYTDNETWAGPIHPHQALREYRESTGIDARLIVASMSATESTITDPNDQGSLDIAGMDSAVPTMIADFSRGSI